MIVQEFPLVETHVAPLGLAVAVYREMGRPPLLVGAVQETFIERFPANALTAVGAEGAVAGMTGAEGDEGSEEPLLFDPVTLKVYDVPLERPETVQSSAPFVEHDALPGEAVTT